MKSRRSYPTDLSDEQWTILKPLVPEAKPGGRPRTHQRRELLEDAIFFYVVRGGCAWRLLPHDFPPWHTAYHYFRLWRIDGTWERNACYFAGANPSLREGRREAPTAAILQRISVWLTHIA